MKTNNMNEDKPRAGGDSSSSALLGKFWCSYGKVAVNVGDSFELAYPDDLTGKWEVRAGGGYGGYSPSGIGGTAVIVCAQGDRSEEFCADSVAAAILRSRNPGKTYAELKALNV